MATDAAYRWDPFRGEWVIVAGGREARPYDFAPRPKTDAQRACPFCHGREAETPPAIAEYKLSDSQFSWDVRVVPNKYPALTDGDPRSADGSTHAGSDEHRVAFGKELPASGRHEVIIESPLHVSHWSDLTVDHLDLVLQSIRGRLRAATDEGRAYGLAFKNVGPEAGASLEHAHSQFMALDVLPVAIADREERTAMYWRSAQQCLTCAWINWELEQQVRVVHADAQWIAACPYFARVPGETWIAPRSHQCHFHELTSDAAFSLAAVLQDVLPRCRAGVSCDAYNAVFQTPPLQTVEPEAGHWVLQILPRRVTTAGFEWATDCNINTIPPEEAARMISLAARNG